ncbi:MAG: hypothetical protein Greene041679_66 [Parcubacteria group bacterium Greene0416_79]|nr:MAG: hypothetical protein Greene041679_66 [Parcubacteria group bacterium Greene0416_79]
MKRLLLTILLTATLVGTAFTQAQEPFLPIGENVDKREMEFYLSIGSVRRLSVDAPGSSPLPGGMLVTRQVKYMPQTTIPLARFLEEHLREMAVLFSPLEASIFDSDYFFFYINNVGPGPFVRQRQFRPTEKDRRLIIPEKVLDIEYELTFQDGTKFVVDKLEYGDVVIPLRGCTGVEVEARNLWETGTNRFSTLKQTGGSVCRIDHTLFNTFVVLSREYTVPRYLWFRPPPPRKPIEPPTKPGVLNPRFCRSKLSSGTSGRGSYSLGGRPLCGL